MVADALVRRRGSVLVTAPILALTKMGAAYSPPSVARAEGQDIVVMGRGELASGRRR